MWKPACEAHWWAASLTDMLPRLWLPLLVRHWSRTRCRYWEDVLDNNDLLGVAARVAAPALYVNVADDEVIPLAGGQALVDRLAHATLITVPGRSPMDVWRDRPGVQRIAQFLAEHLGVETDLVRAQRRARKSRVVHLDRTIRA